MEQPWIPWAVFAAGGVGGLLTLFLRRTIVIFASAAIGSWFVVSGILFFFAGPGALQQPSQTLLAVREGWVAVACWAVLAFAGALAQFATRAPAPQPRPRDNPPRA
jgi:ABC-type Co2+ transport system permease subunit